MYKQQETARYAVRVQDPDRQVRFAQPELVQKTKKETMIPETRLLVLDFGDVDQFYRKGQVLAGERIVGIDRHRLWRHIDDRDPAV